MKKKNINKRLGKKEKAKILREQEDSELLKKYIEGTSNIDKDKLEADDLWKLIGTEGLSIQEKEKLIGKPISLISVEEWLEKERAKLNADRPKEPPSYKLQDPANVLAAYHQKFVEKLKEFEPQLVEDLRGLAANFESLFSNKIEKDYIHILQSMLQKLLFQRHIRPDYEYTPVNFSYIWGEVENALILTNTYYIYKKSGYRIKINERIKTLIDKNVYTLQAIENIIENTFQKTAKDKDSILANYLFLQTKIYLWIGKYNLQKDWLVEYAYFFIDEFSKDKNISVEDLKVKWRIYRSNTKYHNFDFKTHGWLASEYGESAPEYKARVKKEFERQLDDYLSEATDRLELDKLKKFTKPPTYQSVEWAAYALIKGCNSERLVEKFYPSIAADKNKNGLTIRAFHSKKKHIENEIRKLKAYRIPMNKYFETNHK